MYARQGKFSGERPIESEGKKTRKLFFCADRRPKRGFVLISSAVRAANYARFPSRFHLYKGIAIKRYALVVTPHPGDVKI